MPIQGQFLKSMTLTLQSCCGGCRNATPCYSRRRVVVKAAVTDDIDFGLTAAWLPACSTVIICRDGWLQLHTIHLQLASLVNLGSPLRCTASNMSSVSMKQHFQICMKHILTTNMVTLKPFDDDGVVHSTPMLDQTSSKVHHPWSFNIGHSQLTIKSIK